MFKCRKFKISFNVNDGKLKGGNQKQNISYGTTSLNGAYRVNRTEFSQHSNSIQSQAQVKDIVPAPPPLPSEQITKPPRGVKVKKLPPSIPERQPGASLNPQGPTEPDRNSRVPSAPNNGKQQLDAYRRVEKKRLEEQKKLEKKRLEEQKKLEKKRLQEQNKSQKLALQEQAKQDKIRKEKEKKEAQQLKKDMRMKKAVSQKSLANPLAQSSSQAAGRSNQMPPQSAAPYSTNTLNSSISKTSGPPPYSEVPQLEGTGTNSNVQYSKPVDKGSWDLISQHRNNVIVNRHANTTKSVKGQTTMDLNYTLGEDKSEA